MLQLLEDAVLEVEGRVRGEKAPEGEPARIAGERPVIEDIVSFARGCSVPGQEEHADRCALEVLLQRVGPDGGPVGCGRSTSGVVPSVGGRSAQYPECIGAVRSLLKRWTGGSGGYAAAGSGLAHGDGRGGRMTKVTAGVVTESCWERRTEW